MKKILSFAMASVMALGLLAGCSAAGSGEGNAPSTSSTEVETSTAATQNSGSASQFENKELNIAVFEGGYGSDFWYSVVENFEAAYPGVTVNMQISPTIADTIRPQIASGNIPDFLVLNGTSYDIITSLIQEHGLLDITDVFEGVAIGSDEALRDQITDGLLDSTTCCPYGDGKIYQAPLNGAPAGFVYNKTLFEQNGWDIPATWDEFFALGDEAKAQGISLMTYPGIYPNYLQNVLLPAMETAMGGPEEFSKITSYEEGSILNTAALDVLKIFERLADEGYILPGSVALNHTQSQQEQMNNHALFIPVGTWIESEMADSPRAEGYSFAMAPAPAVEEGQDRYCWVAMETMSIPAAAENPELAKEFLRFLYTDESIRLFAEKANAVGATKTALEIAKEYISSDMYQMYSVLSEDGVIPTVITFDTQAQGSKVVLVDELWNPASDVVNGTMTAEEWALHIEDAFATIREELAASSAS